MPGRMPSAIVSACLGVTALALGTARADDRPEMRESASPWAFDSALVAGAGHGRSTADYDSDEDEPSMGSRDRATNRAPTAAIDLAVSARSSGLLLGGFARVGVAFGPNPFSGASEPAPFLLMGPRVALAPAALRGLELRAGGGLAYLFPLAVGVSATIGAGYPIGELAGGTVMLGLEGSGVWTRAGEDGDHGRYTYRYRLLGANLVLGLRR
jgi:hypothetical protein